MNTYVKLITVILTLFLGTITPTIAEETIIKSHGISTFGDLKYGPDFKHFDYVNPDAPKGGEFSTWGFGTFDSLNPYILKGQAAVLSTIFFESLMSSSLDEPDSMYGLLAESIEYPKNRQWAIFNLRPESKFSDGTSVTAEDVVFSFNVLTEKGQPSYKSILNDFEKVEALTPQKVKYTFKQGANTRELPLVASGLPVFSKAYYTENDFSVSSLKPALGSSQYVLDKVTPGKTISFKRRTDYWGKDLPINKGRNNFDKIRVEYYADYSAAFEGFKGGVYNFRTEASSKSWATGYDFPGVEKGWVIKKTLPDASLPPIQAFWFNLRKEKFQDPRVREAIGLMFNFEWSNKTLFYDVYNRTHSFWMNSNMEAKGMIGSDELSILAPYKDTLPTTVFEEDAFLPNKSKTSQIDRAALRKAGKLLDSAGWKVVNGKRTNQAGEVLKIELINDSPTFERVLNPYVSNLKRLGIEANLGTVDPAQSAERQKKFDYDIIIQAYATSLTPGFELRSRFSSKTADIEGSANLTGIKDPAIDALISKIEQAKTREELDVAVRALDRTLRAMHIWVPQWHNAVHRIAYLDVLEHPENLPPYSLGELDIWWYNAEKAEKLKAEGAF